MLNRTLLGEDAILFNLEFMSWLIREFGAPHAPAVPSPLHKSVPIYNRYWSEDDQRSAMIWAEDELSFLKTQFHMQGWDVSLRPDGDIPCQWENNQPIISFDPLRCGEPGYFTANVLLHLSQILVSTKLDPDTLSDDIQRQLTVLTICYLGQGFTLAGFPSSYLAALMPGGKLTKTGTRDVINAALFGTALGLSCRRFPQDQIIPVYGSILSKPSYKKLWGGFKQLEAYQEEIETMKMLIGKGEQRSVEPMHEAMSA